MLMTTTPSTQIWRQCFSPRGLRSAWLALFLLAAGLAGRSAAVGQSVRAHYANGQVWVVWDVQEAVLTNCVPTITPVLSNGVPTVISNCLPATYAIYWSPNPVTNTTTATLVGRLFEAEWAGAILKDDIRASFGVRPTCFRIPDGAGGSRLLATNEGLFVHTVRSNFAGHYAVRPFGLTNVPAVWRAPLTNAFYSLADPPTCHFQARGTNDGYPVEWWTMWADGDTNLSAGRSDFPVMENSARRGLPHNFSVTEPRTGGWPARDVPACVAIHSGDGQAKMWLPGNNGFNSIGLSPSGGLLIAVEDRFHSVKNGAVDAESIVSTGYVPSFDPFFNHQLGLVLATPPDHLPGSNELIVPYPMYRLNWTLDWLYAHKNVDSNRVALVGHSGGAKGSLLWSHASPERFASVGLYNPAIGQFPAGDTRLVGTREQNLPLLLTNRSGQLVRATEIHEYAASYSPMRDLPFTRMFHGKREENWVLDDDQNSEADVGAIYRQVDALGLGAALFWDLRRHGMDTWTIQTLSNDVAHPNNCGANRTVNLSGSWGIGDLWVPTLATQFRRDDATNQIRHRADRSYPAFFNCALRGEHGDLGSVIYTNNTFYFEDNRPYDGLVTTTECLPPWTGDKRGTWGGYFDWEPTIVDTPTNWSAVLYLVGAGSAFNPVEICPDAARVCDVAIRRPQRFVPPAGAGLEWRLEVAATGARLTNGVGVVGPDGLVTVPSVVVGRDPGRVRLTVSLAGGPVVCPAPRLSIRMLTNNAVELSWTGCAGEFYQIESTPDFQRWSTLTPPLAAPAGGGLMSWQTAVVPPLQFFRLVSRPLTNSPVPVAPGVYANRTFVHGGVTRSYRLNVPTNYSASTPSPLVLMLHGHNQTADEFANNLSSMARTANAQGVILVFPDGTRDSRGTGWNILSPTPTDPIDDVGFLLALIDSLDVSLNIDRKRIYAGGFSNGGQMVHRLGAATTNVFAAFAAVGSAIAGEFGGSSGLQYQAPPSEPRSILIVNATNDCKRPFWGGINEDGTLQPAAFESAAHWTNANACIPPPVLSTNRVVTNHVRRVFAGSCAGPYPPFNALVTNVVIREHYQLTCTPGTEVLFVTLSDGGHQWPEAQDNVGFDASAEALQFFLRHCRCDAVGAVDDPLPPSVPGRSDWRLCDQDYSRLYRIQVPQGYNPAVATPLVFALHGGGQTMAAFADEHPALFSKCNAEGVILVLPEALDHPVSRETLWMNKPFDYVTDDRAFLTNLIERLATKLNVDRARIYLTGFSSGGAFSHYFAATYPGVVAAIAPVCTQTGWNDPVTGAILAPPAPLEPMAVMMVRGTADPKRPYNGGLNVDGVLCRSAAQDVAYWTAGSACALAPVTTVTGYGVNQRFPNCAGTTEVVLVRVDTMPHLWPDAADGFGFDANVSVIDFLLRHTR